MAAVLGAVATACMCIGFWIWRRGTAMPSRITTLLGALIAIAGGVGALAALTFIVGWLFSLNPRASSSPAHFQREFGFSAPVDVQDLRSYSVSSTDSVVHYLDFLASPSTVAAITAGRFRPTSGRECAAALVSSAHTPPWWKPPRPTADCYVASPFDHAFSTNTAWLTYDPNIREVHFLYEGID